MRVIVLWKINSYSGKERQTTTNPLSIWVRFSAQIKKKYAEWRAGTCAGVDVTPSLNQSAMLRHRPGAYCRSALYMNLLKFSHIISVGFSACPN